MDLLSFDAEPLYFDNPPSEEVVQLLQQAAEDYSDGQSEAGLQRAFQLAPENLMVLVSLFRYFFLPAPLSRSPGYQSKSP
ncbi:hypothetical protein E4P82_18480 [Candidatus Competibacter phosphatis]|uniref:Uncharacterized protein n=1 Tax=Candidatus Competibacter phosphatis TaxID=221280 RepID=A0ABX1TQN9_9GAMM|nr:hypothetical protein [Candidatus Competibacter phosphatis]NMQ21001.1 hypothetical protein [Candidatus Competibacter phosphatis]